MGQASEAVKFHEQALMIAREIADTKNTAAALSSLGEAYSALENPEKAIAFYQESLNISRAIGDWKETVGNLGFLGQAYAELGEVEKAQDCIAELASLSDKIDDDYRLWQNIGQIHSSLKNHRDAFDAYSKAISLAPYLSPLYQSRAKESMAMENWAVAASDLQRSEELEPASPLREARRGDLALWQKHFDEAINHYEHLIEKSNNPETRFDLALAQIGIGAVAAAEENFKIALDAADDSQLRNMKEELKRARRILSESDLLDKIDQQILV
jgi:tetratricopeptide (TPR) repeat protein